MLSETQFRQLPLFITSMSRWDGDTSSAPLALAKVMSRTNPIYYIDFPYSYTDFWRERHKPAIRRRKQALLWGKNYLQPVPGQSKNMVNVTPQLVLPFYSLPPGRLFNTVGHHNNKVVAKAVNKIIAKQGIVEYIFLNSFNPWYFANLHHYLTPTLSVYQSRDAIEHAYGHGVNREDECVGNYDLAVATSKQLCRNIESRTECEVRYLPNGGDVQLFRMAVEQPLPKPTELQAIHTPVIGYTGAVCQRIDYELLVKTAHAHPDKTIVIVGPRREKEHTGIDLDKISNIVFTGPKKLEELPAYLRHFDCAVIPFRYDNLTAGIYPLKINEYLAAGKAVVTTDFSEDIAAFREQVYLSSTHDDFIAAINKAIRDNGEAKQAERVRTAEKNAWENRAEIFWNLAWATYRKKWIAGAPARKPAMRVVP